MNQQIKSFVLFIVLLFILFFGAHKLARTSDVKFDQLDTRAASFIDLVNALDAIDFDIDFVNSFDGGLGDIAIQVPPPPPETGRRNPFAPANVRSYSAPVDPPAPQTLLLR